MALIDHFTPRPPHVPRGKGVNTDNPLDPGADNSIPPPLLPGGVDPTDPTAQPGGDTPTGIIDPTVAPLTAGGSINLGGLNGFPTVNLADYMHALNGSRFDLAHPTAGGMNGVAGPTNYQAGNVGNFGDSGGYGSGAAALDNFTYANFGMGGAQQPPPASSGGVGKTGKTPPPPGTPPTATPPVAGPTVTPQTPPGGPVPPRPSTTPGPTAPMPGTQQPPSNSYSPGGGDPTNPAGNRFGGLRKSFGSDF